MSDWADPNMEHAKWSLNYAVINVSNAQYNLKSDDPATIAVVNAAYAVASASQIIAAIALEYEARMRDGG